MIKFIFLSTLLMLLSCQKAKKESLQDVVKAKGSISVKTIPAASVEEAQMVIENQLNFMRMLFEQSFDPYYNTPKWSDKCLAENKVGSLKKYGNKLHVVSELYLNQAGQPGHCSDSPEAIKGWITYLYCDDNQGVLRIKSDWDPIEVAGESLCD